ncbi:MAG: hypothetical protein O2894_05230 [Planctomycetota bacterium]|nr:hypothetical protein [Planctomycetota bacterium]
MRMCCTTLLLFLFLGSIVAMPASLRAEDDPAAPQPAEEPQPEEPKPDEPQSAEPVKPEPDPTLPVYSIEFLMPGEEDVPGWKVTDRGAPAGSPTEAAMEAMSEACKCSLDDSSFYVETAVLKRGEDSIGIAMIDVDRSVSAFRIKLDEAAAQNGWRVVELGGRGRLLVLGAGSAQTAAHDALEEHVVYALAELAMNRLRGGAGNEEAGREAAIEYSDAIGRVAPGSGIAFAVVGVVHWIRSFPKKHGEKPDPAELQAANASWSKALAPDAKYPPRKSVLVFCAGQHGGLLLERKTADVLAEATRALKVAVEHEIDGKDNGRRFQNRYNLSCALARAKAIDEAIEMLKAALEVAKSMPDAYFRTQYTHIQEKDDDMKPLRDDPRFSKLMADFKPAEKPKPKGHP